MHVVAALLAILTAVAALPAAAEVVVHDAGGNGPVRHRTASFLPARSDVPIARHGDFAVQYRVGALDVDRKTLPRFRRVVDATLNDARGWNADGAVAFRRVRHDADFTIWLAAPLALEALNAGCSRYYSCRVGDDVYVNAMRWREGADAYRRASLRDYRKYVINHEVGHWLGLAHSRCPGEGAVSPVMQQQSKGLGGCEARAWPLPTEQNRALRKLRER